MRLVIWLVVLFVVAVVAATFLGTNDGLVTVYFRHWRTELSLNLFMLLVLAAFFVILTTMRTLEAVFTLPERAREWRALQRERAANRALRDALAEFLAARYTRAHKAAEKALQLHEDVPGLAQDGDFRLLALMLSASSLHRLQDVQRRQEVQHKLHHWAPQSASRPAAEGARLIEAEWALDDRDAHRALELLSLLPAGLSRRTHALRLRLQAARLALQPEEALQTARLLAKHQAFSSAAALSLLRTLAEDVLDASRDVEQLKRQWERLDAAERRDPALACHAARRALSWGAQEEARQWLRPVWERLAELSATDRAQAARTLSLCVQDIGPEWLPRVEAALSTYPNDPHVSAAASLVLAQRRLWGKARKLLLSAASHAMLDAPVRRRAWLELAQLAREEGDESRAAQCEGQAARIPDPPLL